MEIRQVFKIIVSFLLAGMIVIELYGITAVASEQVILIDGSQSGSLQEIINKAEKGQTLQLKPGVYKGPIYIDKPLFLTGSKGTIIDGGGKGNVITVQSGDVKIKGLTIEHSGRFDNNSGIYIDNGEHVVLENNIIRNVHFGIYIKNGIDITVDSNSISGYDGHFSRKGNGIHIFKGKGNVIENNYIYDVQDGIYFDFAEEVIVRHNEVRDSRYGLHYMFSGKVRTEENLTAGNITGLMIMDSAELEYAGNRVQDQFHVRGFGILVYRSQNIVLERNDIIRNSVGISFEESENTVFKNNVIAANQVGLQFRRGNVDNVFTENNFIGNIVSSTVGNEELRLDNGVKGNYWDDYKSFDVDGDGIGEIPYKAGSLYDTLLKRQPLWQFYFESPAVNMWTRAESMFPAMGSVEVYDYHPLVDPVRLSGEEQIENGKNSQLLLTGMLFLGIATVIIFRGRRRV